jgi:peptide/nickel transport system permease protein
MAGFFLGTLTAGAVITENIFSWPGTGRLLVISVANRDIPSVQIVVLGIGVTLIAANLVVDLLSLLVNPRLRDAAS